MYTTHRYWLKYGNEDDEVIVTTKEWDSLTAALKYLRRYQSGIRYVSCEIINELGITVYEDFAGRGEILYDARGNVVDRDDKIDTFPATADNKKKTNRVKETSNYYMKLMYNPEFSDREISANYEINGSQLLLAQLPHQPLKFSKVVSRIDVFTVNLLVEDVFKLVPHCWQSRATELVEKVNAWRDKHLRNFIASGELADLLNEENENTGVCFTYTASKTADKVVISLIVG